MRLGKFLEISQLIGCGIIANEACNAGRVLVNDKPARALLNIGVGDTIEIRFGINSIKVGVLDVQETMKKDKAKEFYRYL